MWQLVLESELESVLVKRQVWAAVLLVEPLARQNKSLKKSIKSHDYTVTAMVSATLTLTGKPFGSALYTAESSSIWQDSISDGCGDVDRVWS